MIEQTTTELRAIINFLYKVVRDNYVCQSEKKEFFEGVSGAKILSRLFIPW